MLGGANKELEVLLALIHRPARLRIPKHKRKMDRSNGGHVPHHLVNRPTVAGISRNEISPIGNRFRSKLAHQIQRLGNDGGRLQVNQQLDQFGVRFIGRGWVERIKMTCKPKATLVGRLAKSRECKFKRSEPSQGIARTERLEIECHQRIKNAIQVIGFALPGDGHGCVDDPLGLLDRQSPGSPKINRLVFQCNSSGVSNEPVLIRQMFENQVHVDLGTTMEAFQFTS